VASAGCNQTTPTLTRRIAVGGYAIWYPAESGIEPGQIWLYDGTLRAKFADRAAKLSPIQRQPVDLDLKRPNELKGTLSSTFTEAAISKAGPFSAELYAGSAREGSFTFGPMETVSIEIGDSLLKNAEAKYGPAYAKALRMVREETPGLVLIASVVQVPWVDYTLICEDPFQVIDRLPRVRDLVHARIDANVVDERKLHLRLTPITGMLTIGVTPVRGESMTLTTEDARKCLSHDLLLSLKQSYAFRLPVPSTVAEVEGPIVLPGDSAATVKAKYLDATTATTRPSSTTQSSSSGRVLMPMPESRPTVTQPKY
jgi:hypothetical protein